MLEQIAGPAYYIAGRVNIGALIAGQEAVFIDTGLDESQARRAAQAIEQAKLRAVAAINTHAHADHCGGNAFLRKRTGAAVYAPPVEAALIQHPELEPFYLFGASPFPAIDGKWFHAAPSLVDHILGSTVSLCGLTLQILPTPGHSINQVGVLTPDVAYLGDALVTPSLLERYPIQYCYDVVAHRNTLAALATLEKLWYVGAHFAPTRDLDGILAANRRNLERTAEAVLGTVTSTATTEEVVARTAEALGVLSMDPPAYLLNAAAIKAHLSAHVRDGRLEFEIQSGRPVWRRRP